MRIVLDGEDAKAITRYFVVSRNGTDYTETMASFVSGIDEMLADNWRLVGGIHYAVETIRGVRIITFHQAMEKVFFEPIKDTEHGK